MKNYINISSKILLLIFTKQFNTVIFKLQLFNLNPKHTLNIPKICFNISTLSLQCDHRKSCGCSRTLLIKRSLNHDV